MADVLQLAYVARKRELPQLRHRRFGDALGLHAQLLCAALQKVAREHRDVFTPLAQSGQAQADHVQAVEQVFTETTFLDALLQILVGGGNHAHIGFDSAVPTHAVEVPVRQHPQQARLQVKRHVTNFVEEQRTAVGLLEAAPARSLRASEGPAFVTEEFALQQILRDRCGVDGHKGAIGTRRMFVQCARHQLFARTRFAGDEHRHMALRQASDGAEHILHGRGLAQHLGGLIAGHVHHFFTQAFVHRTADQLDRLGQVKRLGQVFKRATGKRRHRAVQVGIRRHDDDRQARQALLDLRQQIQPRTTGHADVTHQHLWTALRALGFQRLQHLARVDEAAGGQRLTLERFLQHKADGLVIVNDPDRLHGAAFQQTIKARGSGS